MFVIMQGFECFKWIPCLCNAGLSNIITRFKDCEMSESCCWKFQSWTGSMSMLQPGFLQNTLYSSAHSYSHKHSRLSCENLLWDFHHHLTSLWFFFHKVKIVISEVYFLYIYISPHVSEYKISWHVCHTVGADSFADSVRFIYLN